MMTTQPTSKTLGTFRSAANRPTAAAPGSPSRRTLAMLTRRPPSSLPGLISQVLDTRAGSPASAQSIKTPKLFEEHGCAGQACARRPTVGDPSSPTLEQLVELPLPSALFLRRHQHRNDFLLRQHPNDARRIRLPVLARRQPPELGEELLALPAEHEVGGKPRRVRMRRLGVHADLTEEQRDRVERPHVDRAT